MLEENINLEEELVELTGEELEGITGGATVRPKRGTVKVRSGPGKKYSVIAEVDTDDRLTCLGVAKRDKEDHTWIKVSVYGVTGWVRGDKVK